MYHPCISFSIPLISVFPAKVTLSYTCDLLDCKALAAYDTGGQEAFVYVFYFLFFGGGVQPDLAVKQRICEQINADHILHSRTSSYFG